MYGRNIKQESLTIVDKLALWVIWQVLPS